METFESGLVTKAQFKAVMDALEKGARDRSHVTSISGTGPVEEFEEAFARQAGGKYALALSSCTAAIHNALMALGIGPGDEVIVSPYTWGQSVSPVLFAGATAVFADIDPETLTIDPNSVESRLSQRTRAIIPVHLFGNPADTDSLCDIGKRNGLAVISDGAQAFGALSKGRKIGGLGDAACYSLGRGKAVFGGEGGVLVTNDESFYQRAVAVSQHPLRALREVFNEPGSTFMDELGLNYRIHPLAAIMALADLEAAGKRVAHRRRILEVVYKKLDSVPGIKPVRFYPGDRSAAYGIPLTYKSGEGGVSCEHLVQSLQSDGIMLMKGPIRVPIHMRTTFQQGNNGWLRIAPHPSHRTGSCPVAESRCEFEELQLFDACSLDRISIDDATETIKILEGCCHSMTKADGPIDPERANSLPEGVDW